MAICVIGIAGHIGSGKSETMNYLQQHKNELERFVDKSVIEKDRVRFLPEYVDTVALDLFYRDPKTYADDFEESLLHSRKIRHCNAKISPGLVIVERTLLEGFHIFCQNSKDSGFLSAAGYTGCEKFVSRTIAKLDPDKQQRWNESLLVYHKINNDHLNVLIERQLKRKREGEEGISLDYNTAIQEGYNAFFDLNNLSQIYGRWGLQPPKVLEIDASVDFNKDSNYHRRILDEIIGALEVNFNGQ